MKKLILLTLALTFLLILSQQALASKDYNLTNCEKPRYGWGTTWHCMKEDQKGTTYVPSPQSPENSYPKQKIIIQSFTGQYNDVWLGCYEDLWNPEGTTLKKLGLLPQKGKSEWFHKWLQTSSIHSYWNRKVTTFVTLGNWVHEDNHIWETYNCPYTHYSLHYEDEDRHYAKLYVSEEGPPENK